MGMNIDIPALDDDQLFEMLKKNGVEVGPIVASTRKFYEKKLSAALAGENATNGTNGTKEFSDTEPEDEEEEQPAVVEVVAKRRTPRSSKLGSSPLAESGLRQRRALADELDSSPASPGARKAHPQLQDHGDDQAGDYQVQGRHRDGGYEALCGKKREPRAFSIGL